MHFFDFFASEICRNKKKAVILQPSNIIGNMTNQQIELAKWWTSLRITDKENISKQPYPDCSRWWNEQGTEAQLLIMEHAGIARAPRNKTYGFT